MMVKPPETTLFRKLTFCICRFFWPPYGKQAVVIHKPFELDLCSNAQLATHAGLLSSIMILFFFWYHIRRMYKKTKLAGPQETELDVDPSDESIEEQPFEPFEEYEPFEQFEPFDFSNDGVCIKNTSTQTICGLEESQTFDVSAEQTSTTSCSSKPPKPVYKDKTFKVKRTTDRKWKL